MSEFQLNYVIRFHLALGCKHMSLPFYPVCVPYIFIPCCTISNIWSILVADRPVPPPHKASAEITFGYIHGIVNLTCEAEAEPAATFSWFRHNKKISPKVHLINSEGHFSTLQV